MPGSEGDPISISRMGGLDQEKDWRSEVSLQLNEHIFCTFTAKHCSRLLGRLTSNLSSCGLQARDTLGINNNSFGPSSWKLISAKHWIECWEMKIKQMWILSSVLAGLRKQIHKLS